MPIDGRKIAAKDSRLPQKYNQRLKICCNDLRKD